MVHRPDLAHERLSPSNCHELLFDDVIWVRRARQEFDAFVDLMRDRGIEVLLFHELLAETLEDGDAREWLLSRRLRPEEVTTMFSGELTAWMSEMPSDELATRMTGGVTVSELPEDISAIVRRAMRPNDFVIGPLPNQLYMRDTSAWIYGGVSINAMYWPARQHETLNVETVYRFHPRFRDAGFPIWYGGFDHDWGGATIEGGDIMPVGDGVVLIGQGERSTARAASILAQNLFGTTIRRRGRRSARPRATLRCPHRRRRVRGRAQPVGRRQQPRRACAGCRRLIRAKRGDQRAVVGRRGRGSHHCRPGARARPRRRPLHDLPGRARQLRGARGQ